jgi:hypothetical protein
MLNRKPHIAQLQATDKSKASFKQAPSTLQAKFKQASSQVSKQGFRHSKELSGGATVNTVVSVLLRAIVVASLVTAKDLKDSCHSSRLRPPFGIRISARACLKKQQLLTTTTTRAYHNSSMGSTIPCRLLLLLETLLLERAAKSSKTRLLLLEKGSQLPTSREFDLQRDDDDDDDDDLLVAVTHQQ